MNSQQILANIVFIFFHNGASLDTLQSLSKVSEKVICSQKKNVNDSEKKNRLMILLSNFDIHHTLGLPALMLVLSFSC